MKTIVTITTIATILTIATIDVFAQAKIGDVTLPATIVSGNENLVYNGGGIRKKYFMSMYVGALYLKQKSADAAKIVAADEPMAMRIHIVSGLITSKRMEESIHEGFEKSTNGNMAPLKDKIDDFISVFREEIKVNDEFDLVYVPKEGVKILKNNQQKKVIAGLDFKNALFGIWLGNNPVDTDLKQKLMGK